jgi:hypothetical protein
MLLNKCKSAAMLKECVQFLTGILTKHPGHPTAKATVETLTAELKKLSK